MHSSSEKDALKMPLKSNYTLLPQGETEPLTASKQYQRWNRKRIWQWSIPGILVLLFVIVLGIFQGVKGSKDTQIRPHPNQAACPQYPAIQSLSADRNELEVEVGDEIGSDVFFDKSLKRMQGAVQIPTESFDDMGKVGEDPRWDVFVDFHAYLKTTFSQVSVSSPIKLREDFTNLLCQLGKTRLHSN